MLVVFSLAVSFWSLALCCGFCIKTWIPHSHLKNLLQSYPIHALLHLLDIPVLLCCFLSLLPLGVVPCSDCSPSLQQPLPSFLPYTSFSTVSFLLWISFLDVIINSFSSKSPESNPELGSQILFLTGFVNVIEQHLDLGEGTATFYEELPAKVFSYEFFKKKKKKE